MMGPGRAPQVAIQKHSGVTGGSHGWKWSLQNLLSYIEGTSGPEAAEEDSRQRYNPRLPIHPSAALGRRQST